MLESMLTASLLLDELPLGLVDCAWPAEADDEASSNHEFISSKTGDETTYLGH